MTLPDFQSYLFYGSFTYSLPCLYRVFHEFHSKYTYTVGNMVFINKEKNEFRNVHLRK